MKFALGQVIVTPRASQSLDQWGRTVEDLLARHQRGEWGDVSKEMSKINERGLTHNGNLVSVYTSPTGDAITVFTKADRSVTMIHVGPSVKQ